MARVILGSRFVERRLGPALSSLTNFSLSE